MFNIHNDIDPEREDHTKCTLCLQNYKRGDRTKKIKCTHVFHEDCVDRFTVKNKKCSICQEEVTDMPDFPREGSKFELFFYDMSLRGKWIDYMLFISYFPTIVFAFIAIFTGYNHSVHKCGDGTEYNCISYETYAVALGFIYGFVMLIWYINYSESGQHIMIHLFQIFFGLISVGIMFESQDSNSDACFNKMEPTCNDTFWNDNPMFVWTYICSCFPGGLFLIALTVKKIGWYFKKGGVFNRPIKYQMWKELHEHVEPSNSVSDIQITIEVDPVPPTSRHSNFTTTISTTD